VSKVAATCPMCGGSGALTPGDLHPDQQTASDHDQTASDADQTWSDHDQTASDRDQRSADEDQEASDADLAAGGDAAVHDQSAAARARTHSDRATVSELRDDTADKRLDTASERDVAAAERDREANARDREARLRDALDDFAGSDDVLLKAERLRASAASDRAKAAEDRTKAARDREQAAAERELALRAQARARDALVLAATDELTGVSTRKDGLLSIAREIERAARTGVGLVLAFVDVNGLKEVNDTEGHPAGDRLLQLVAETMRVNVRPYDVIVRYGGDEFLCAMPNLDRATAGGRMKKVATTLAASHKHHSITFGLTEYEPGDDITGLISRADADLLQTRRADRNS
jgi:diguanylate cyclase (GGDEF)-like protein